MIREFNPGIPRKTLATKEEEAQEPNTNYAEMALGKPFGSLREMTEQDAIKMIAGAGNPQELLTALESINVTPTFYQLFGAAKLRDIHWHINNYLEKGTDLEMVSKRGGLRDAVQKLRISKLAS